jgi:ABC-type uncharacterized transport system involved in gliding motility auxiliary subunit
LLTASIYGDPNTAARLVVPVVRLRAEIAALKRDVARLKLQLEDRLRADLSLASLDFSR